MRSSSPTASQPVTSDISAVTFVQNNALLKGLSAPEVAELLKNAEVVDYGPAQIILREGAEGDFMYLIYEGTVHINKRMDDHSVYLATLDRAAVFGEMAVLTKLPRAASVVTQTDCRLVRFAANAVRAVAEVNPRFGRKLAALMAARNRSTESKIRG